MGNGGAGGGGGLTRPEGVGKFFEKAGGRLLGTHEYKRTLVSWANYMALLHTNNLKKLPGNNFAWNLGYEKNITLRRQMFLFT